MEWKEEYQRKLTTAEEAIKLIKPSGRVAFAYGLEPNDLGLALLSGEFQNIKLYIPAPGR